jgi:hypothetical protein
MMIVPCELATTRLHAFRMLAFLASWRLTTSAYDGDQHTNPDSKTSNKLGDQNEGGKVC